MECFGFDDIFLGWIQDLFSLERISILINGFPKGYFSFSGGVRVRQGDPLSLFLFCFVGNFLRKYILSLIDSYIFISIISPLDIVAPTLFLYVEKLLIFG